MGGGRGPPLRSRTTAAYIPAGQRSACARETQAPAFAEEEEGPPPSACPPLGPPPLAPIAAFAQEEGDPPPSRPPPWLLGPLPLAPTAAFAALIVKCILANCTADAPGRSRRVLRVCGGGEIVRAFWGRSDRWRRCAVMRACMWGEQCSATGLPFAYEPDNAFLPPPSLIHIHEKSLAPSPSPFPPSPDDVLAPFRFHLRPPPSPLSSPPYLRMDLSRGRDRVR